MAAGVLWWYNFHRKHEMEQAVRCKGGFAFARYLVLIVLVALIPAVRLWSQNGFKITYEYRAFAY